jgi:hypothetical protein
MCDFSGVEASPANLYWQMNPQFGWSDQLARMPQKRRLVVKIPFAQNPENHHLSRIYKSLFSQKVKKEINPSFRSFFEV